MSTSMLECSAWPGRCAGVAKLGCACVRHHRHIHSRLVMLNCVSGQPCRACLTMKSLMANKAIVVLFACGPHAADLRLAEAEGLGLVVLEASSEHLHLDDDLPPIRASTPW
jgi:hypothetical protein